MADEKPKNKPKRKNISRSLAAVIIIAAAGLLYLIYRVTPTRLQLNGVQAVTISDGWSGFGGAVDSTYNLTMSEGSLIGSATFSVTTVLDLAERLPPRTRTDTISIPPEAVTEFLNKLEEAQLESGEYLYRMLTDHNPYTTIYLEMANGTIEIYSQSQGEEHIPWGASINGQAYTINSGIPAQALAILDPYLKRDVLDELRGG